MKAKTIKTILAKVHREWYESITDPNVKKLARRDAIITGGSIVSMLLNEPVNDYDVYMASKESAVEIAKYYINKFVEAHPEYEFDPIEDDDDKHGINLEVTEDRVKIRFGKKTFRPAFEEGFEADEDPSNEIPEEFKPDHATSTEKFRPVYLSANAITLSDKIQIVIRFFGDADVIHENYDFEHCKCYWTSKDKNLVLPSSALEAILTKELVYSGSKYPLASIIRTRKFIQRGYTVNAGQYLKMCMQLNALDLCDLETLEDQLVGMDAVYFAQMLAAIPDDKKENNRVSPAYVFTMIDRFF